jgi:hypothetical protein
MIMLLTANQLSSLPIQLPSGCTIALPMPLVAVDGRLATGHPFVQEDIDYLTARGITVCEALPGDFVIAGGEA